MYGNVQWLGILKETHVSVIEPKSASEEEADADIRQIEQGVSGATEVKEFIPDKPLFADKAIALPSVI